VQEVRLELLRTFFRQFRISSFNLSCTWRNFHYYSNFIITDNTGRCGLYCD